ncbi:MAG: hypothetical protein ACOCW1_05035 [Chitinispirillaceae bacterium]
MRKIRAASGVLLMVVLSITLSGCYTKFASYDNEVLPEEEGSREKEQVDTIVTREREICVWERDMFGYPELRCYQTNYSWSWYDFNNTPWWYRDNPNWYDHRRCPPYYYYDSYTGTCRYGGSDYSPPSDEGGDREELPSRRRSQPFSEKAPSVDSENQALQKKSEPMFDDADNKPISPSVQPSPAKPALSKEPASQQPPKRNSVRSKLGITDSPSDTVPGNTPRPRRKKMGF